MGDIWEGNGSQEGDQTLCQNLDLFSVSNKYKKFWILPERGSYHTAISIMVGMGVPWTTKEKHMEHIIQSIGKGDILPASFHITDKKLKSWGLSGEKISGIKSIFALPEVTAKSLCKIKEGGIYLVKAFKIFNGDDDDVFLSEDYNVLRNMGILFFRSKLMTKTEATILSRTWTGYRSQISYFLSRLKPEGAIKVLDEEDLEPWDFWGCDAPTTKPIVDDPVPDLV